MGKKTIKTKSFTSYSNQGYKLKIDVTEGDYARIETIKADGNNASKISRYIYEKYGIDLRFVLKKSSIDW